MRHFTVFTFFIVVACAAPLSVFAHASPVETHPETSVKEPPREVIIRFSERLEEGVSRISVRGPSGENAEKGKASVGDDPHVLSIPVEVSREGTYIVSWSVISADDGHFTKGGFVFGVGTDIANESSPIEVVQLLSTREIAAVGVELLGNSLLWGFVVLSFLARGILRERNGSFSGALFLVALVGAFLAVCGGIVHIFIKTSELAGLSSIPLLESLSLYLSTKGGLYTSMRIGSILLFLTLLFSFRKSLFTHFFWREGALIGCLLLFALFRALMSHATANPFYPELSVVMNFLHLIEKDVWAGSILVVVLLGAYRPLREYISALAPLLSSFLAINLFAIGITASYIGWLHLKGLDNLSATLWGETFLKLLAASAVLILLRIYNTLLRPESFFRFSAYTLPMEAVAGLFVVFYSGAVILTSPPLSGSPYPKFSAHTEGVAFTLSYAPHEDRKALLVVEGEEEPIVSVIEGGGEEGTLVPLEKRFEGGYVFPSDILPVEGKARISVTLPQRGAYDAHASWEISRADFMPQDGRRFDTLTLLSILTALLGSLLALALHHLSKKGSLQGAVTPFSLALGALGGLLLCIGALVIADRLFGNDFKKACLADGNEWHLMLPTRAGTPLSATPREGCMALGGAYHFADAREYRQVRNPKHASAAFLGGEHFVSGKKTELTFSISEGDGSPAGLFVSHEKLLHVVVVSEDMKEFFHIHPKQEGSQFSTPFMFPRGGSYLIALDYYHGLSPENALFLAEVEGEGQEVIARYMSPAFVGDYEIELDTATLFAERGETISFRIRKEGKDVLDLSPYLAAAMHIAIVKDDFSSFIHTHGEVHPSGVFPTPTPGGHNHAPPPTRFGPVIEAHIPPLAEGNYTLFAEVQHGERVITAPFTLRVE